MSTLPKPISINLGDKRGDNGIKKIITATFKAPKATPVSLQITMRVRGSPSL